MSPEANSSGPEDDQILVAEYALGLLDGPERETVARRIKSEPVLSAEMRLWQNRLSALDSEFAEVAPPASVLPKIEKRLFGESQTATAGGVANWWNSLALWRGLTAAAAAVAVVAIGVNLMQPAQLAPEEYATQLVAAIQAQDGFGVEFIALYDQQRGEVRVTSLRGDAVADKDYELWYINGDAPAVSMGVLPVDARREIELDDQTRGLIDAGTTLAVTLEQKGGSPTGVAQGPIVAVGTAIAI